MLEDVAEAEVRACGSGIGGGLGWRRDETVAQGRCLIGVYETASLSNCLIFSRRHFLGALSHEEVRYGQAPALLRILDAGDDGVATRT